jgi:hypothetical protein
MLRLEKLSLVFECFPSLSVALASLREENIHGQKKLRSRPTTLAKEKITLVGIPFSGCCGIFPFTLLVGG